METAEPKRTKTATAGAPRRRFVGTKSAVPSKTGGILRNQIPLDILENKQLNSAIKQLPANYSFEIHKTIHHVRKNSASMVALQMPEGLQMFACTIADIIEQFTDALTVIMGDVTYGACCVDDYTAVALGCDMLVHYGHSCLVPMDQTTIKTLYIFVEIGIDSQHLHETIRLNFPDQRDVFATAVEELESTLAAGESIPGPSLHRHLRIEHTPAANVESQNPSLPTRLALVSTIQFVAALQRLKEDLSGPYEITIPRSKPLSPGEILGCTAPRLDEVDALLYLGDGRFHLEAIMIANPTVPAFRYDPYSKKLTRERYEHEEMRQVRNDAVQTARKTISKSEPWGVVLGTLGRQGNFNQLKAVTASLQTSYVPILLSELSPAKLALFNPHISTFVQTSCPRLSIDWGYAFDRPLLSVYESAVAVGKMIGWTEDEGRYAMDFYEAGRPWAKSRQTANFDVA
ncbi:diphthamide synthesis protein [Mycena floridula]|nr:diphthamide synthesis protein [Mycena floridula]